MAKKVGSVYAEIRADIKKLQADFDKAQGITQASAKKIQATLDKGISFDKMAMGAVKAGASVYSAFRIVGQAIESAKIGSVLDKQATAFANLSDAAGASSKRMLESLKASSQGLVAESDLMAAAGKAMLMSIPADKISELMKIAAATSKMTGQSITEAFSDITMGVARQSRMILDNLGIIVDVDKANQDYATTLGKTASALNDVEKRQAFMNAVLKSGEDMIKRIGSSAGALDGVNKALAGQKNLWDEINKSTAHFLDETLAAYGGMLDAITEKLKKMRESSSASDRNQEQFLINQNRMYEKLGLRKSGSTSEMMSKFNAKWVGQNESETSDKAAYDKFKADQKEAQKRQFYGSQLVADNQVAYDVEARWKAYEEESKLREKNAEEELKWMEVYRKATMSEFEFERATLDAKLKEYDKFVSDKLALDSWYNAEKRKIDIKEYAGGGAEQDGFRSISEIMSGADDYDSESRLAKSYKASIDNMQKNAEDFEKNNEELWKKSVTYGEETMDQWLELTERTAAAMQDNFSNLFFDAMTGKLKTLEDYAKAVFDAIARMASDMAAQMATEALFGNLSKTGGGGGGGGLLGSIVGMFGVSSGGYTGTNTYGAQTGDWGATMHAGGTVGVSGGPMRSIPASYFASAPRLHQGLAADEYPAILQKGEQVVPKGGGKAAPIVHMHFYSQNGKYDRESVSQAQSGLYASLSRANRRNS